MHIKTLNKAYIDNKKNYGQRIFTTTTTTKKQQTYKEQAPTRTEQSLINN